MRLCLDPRRDRVLYGAFKWTKAAEDVLIRDRRGWDKLDEIRGIGKIWLYLDNDAAGTATSGLSGIY